MPAFGKSLSVPKMQALSGYVRRLGAAARHREALRDEGGAGGDRARRRLLLPDRERRRVRQIEEAQTPRAQAAPSPSAPPARGGRTDEGGKAHLKRANALAGKGTARRRSTSTRRRTSCSSDPVVLFNRGECYRRIGDTENAVDDYREFLEKVPNAPNRAADRGEDRRASETPEPPVATQRRRRVAKPPPAAGRRSATAAAPTARAASAARSRRRRRVGRSGRRRPSRTAPPPAAGDATARRRAWRRPDRAAPSARARRPTPAHRQPPLGLGCAGGPGRRTPAPRAYLVFRPHDQTAAGYGAGQLQVLSGAPSLGHPPRDPGRGRGCRRLARPAACQRDDSILLVEVAGDLTLMPAQLSVTVTADGSPRFSVSAHADHDFIYPPALLWSWIGVSPVP